MAYLNPPAPPAEAVSGRQFKLKLLAVGLLDQVTDKHSVPGGAERLDQQLDDFFEAAAKSEVSHVLASLPARAILGRGLSFAQISLARLIGYP